MNEFIQIATDPAHIAAEASFELVSALIVYPFARWAWKRAIRRHDRDVHGLIPRSR